MILSQYQFSLLKVLSHHDLGLNEIMWLDQRPLTALYRKRLITVSRRLNFRITEEGIRILESKPLRRKKKAPISNVLA